jgi:hypothetical protein
MELNGFRSPRGFCCFSGDIETEKDLVADDSAAKKAASVEHVDCESCQHFAMKGAAHQPLESRPKDCR